MKTEEIIELFRQFESIANEYEGVECWSARELAKLLGYAQWRNFENIVNKAKAACEHAEQEVSYHFAEVGKMVSLGSGSEREVSDYMLTRYACYLVAQNASGICPKLFRRADETSRTGTTTYPRLRTDTSAHQTCRNRKTPVRYTL